ncbi:hypothetical protein ABMA27_004199 [Loxostege sticticalis]|uniref:Nuclear apoptosis-inducing factor 1 n=1 Tax=Loxostege sticticalis TaxID=481309 RepID=A0ABR3HMS0_LOXSC
MKVITSTSQFTMMIEFMEQNGDLSKPAGGPHGRQWGLKKWQELTALLNSDPSGAEKSEDKWRKVWSDFKNNCKKKVARINRSISGTGGGPALASQLTDLEQRVVAIVGIQAATGLDKVEEAGFGQVEVDETQKETVAQPIPSTQIIPDEDWNLPGTSQMSPPRPPPVAEEFEVLPIPSPDETEAWQPPQKRKKTACNTKQPASQLFLEAERNARELEREQNNRMHEIERERIRQRDIELQQRDRELDLQAQWLQFMRDGMNLLERWLNERRS